MYILPSNAQKHDRIFYFSAWIISDTIFCLYLVMLQIFCHGYFSAVLQHDYSRFWFSSCGSGIICTRLFRFFSSHGNRSIDVGWFYSASYYIRTYFDNGWISFNILIDWVRCETLEMLYAHIVRGRPDQIKDLQLVFQVQNLF